MSDQAQIVYSITEQEPAWINLILFSPFFIIGLIAVFFESKEFINKRKNNAIKTKDCVLFYVKIIFSLVVSLVIASGLLRYFFSLNAYQYALKNNNYETRHGYLQNVSYYVDKTGDSNGIELLFTLQDTDFDTGLSYGPMNKFTKDDLTLLEKSFVEIKYIEQNNENVIIEICIIT